MEQQKMQHNNRIFEVQVMEAGLACCSLLFSWMLAGSLVYATPMPFGHHNGILLFSVGVSMGLVLLAMNQYFSYRSYQFAQQMAKIAVSVIVTNFLFIALLYFTQSLQLALYYFVIAAVLQLTLLCVVKRMSEHGKERLQAKQLSLIVSAKGQGEELLHRLRKEVHSQLAFAEGNDPQLPAYVGQADQVYLGPGLSKETKNRILTGCVNQGKRVLMVPETYEIALQKAENTQAGDVPLFSVDGFGLSQAQRLFKRTVDVCGALCGILVTSPLMLFAFLSIKREDGGPAFYKQVRSGLHGKEFEVYKFRSMVVDAEKLTGAVFAAEDDPRITKIGRLMRATRIDEIPQFFNVLKGDMSLVGPRPERPVFVQEFSETIPEYRSRLAVQPGVTGLAQVMGNYTTSAENKVKFDMMYLRNYSIWLDLKILFLTVKVVFTKEQAAGFATQESEGSLEERYAMHRRGEPGGANPPVDSKKRRMGIRLGKAAVTMACCLVIVCGSLFLRYNALAATIAMAMEPTTTDAETVLVVSADGGVMSRTGLDNDGGSLGNRDGSFSNDLTGAPNDIHFGVEEAPNMAGDLEMVGDSARQGNIGLTDTVKASGIALAGSLAEVGLPLGHTSRPAEPPLLRGLGSFSGFTTTKTDARSAGGMVRIQGNLTDPTGAAKGTLVLSEEQIAKALEEMKLSQKLGLVYKFIAKVSTEDLLALEKMADGGFTQQEKQEAKAMMYRYFDETEIAYIKSVYRQVVE